MQTEKETKLQENTQLGQCPISVKLQSMDLNLGPWTLNPFFSLLSANLNATKGLTLELVSIPQLTDNYKFVKSSGFEELKHDDCILILDAQICISVTAQSIRPSFTAYL